MAKVVVKMIKFLKIVLSFLQPQSCIPVFSLHREIKKNKTMYQQMKNNVPVEVASSTESPQNYSQNVTSGVNNSVNTDFEMKLKEFFGINFSLNDETSQKILLEHLRMNREQNEYLSEALDKDPRLAQMLSDMVQGKRNAHSAMARYFGRSMMKLEEGTPEFEEVMLADDERREEVYRLAKERREYEENLEKSKPLIEQFCKERGYEPADFMELIWECIVMPIMSGNYSYEVCTSLDNAINYDKDVEDAFAAGDIKGRNTNIQRLKENFGDGMPKGLSSVAPDISPLPKRSNSLIDKALEA